jgi:hypothetical protein
MASTTKEKSPTKVKTDARAATRSEFLTKDSLAYQRRKD